MANSEMTTATDTDLMFFGENFCGLDPLFHVHCKLFIGDVLNLSPHPKLPGAYCYKNHPIFKVDVMGVIASYQEKERLFVLGVDDGTGVISCCVWKERVDGGDEDFRSFLPESLRSKAQSLYPVFSLGEMIHVRGKIKTYRGVNEITSNYVVPLSSASTELTRMLQLPYLYKNIYDRPFVLASETQERLQLETHEMNTQTKSLEDIMAGLQGLLVNYLAAKVTVFNMETIKDNDDILHSIQDIVGVHQSSEYLENTLDAVLKQMESQGLICSRSDLKDSTYESLLNPKADLKSIILDIIKKEVYDGVEYGCSWMTLRGCLKKTAHYTDISDAALNWCVDQLESSSNIIKITNSCFMAC